MSNPFNHDPCTVLLSTLNKMTVEERDRAFNKCFGHLWKEANKSKKDDKITIMNPEKDR